MAAWSQPATRTTLEWNNPHGFPPCGWCWPTTTPGSAVASRRCSKPTGASRSLGRPKTARAVALVREARPDVVVLDVAMPVMGGAEAMGLILREVSPSPRVVILTMHDRPRLRRELLGAGASAFLAKSASLAEIIAAVKASRPKRPPRGDLGEVPPTA